MAGFGINKMHVIHALDLALASQAICPHLPDYHDRALYKLVANLKTIMHKLNYTNTMQSFPRLFFCMRAKAIKNLSEQLGENKDEICHELDKFIVYALVRNLKNEVAKVNAMCRENVHRRGFRPFLGPVLRALNFWQESFTSWYHTFKLCLATDLPCVCKEGRKLAKVCV